MRFQKKKLNEELLQLKINCNKSKESENNLQTEINQKIKVSQNKRILLVRNKNKNFKDQKL